MPEMPDFGKFWPDVGKIMGDIWAKVVGWKNDVLGWFGGDPKLPEKPDPGPEVKDCAEGLASKVWNWISNPDSSGPMAWIQGAGSAIGSIPGFAGNIGADIKSCAIAVKNGVANFFTDTIPSTIKSIGSTISGWYEDSWMQKSVDGL